MNIQSHSAAFAVPALAGAQPASDAFSPPSASPLLSLIAEHSELRKITMDVLEDEHPAVLRGYEIEDPINDALPATLTEAAALMRWAIARMPEGLDGPVYGDDILRGHEPTEEQVEALPFCFKPLWRVLQFLEQQTAADAAIVEAFGRWRAEVDRIEAAYDAPHDDDFDTGNGDDDIVREIMTMPAGGAEGLAIKAYLFAWAAHGFSPRKGERTHLRPLDIHAPEYLPDDMELHVVSEAVRMSTTLSAAIPVAYRLRDRRAA